MEDTFEVEWEAPPTDRKARSNKFARLAEELRKHPGRWALAESGLNKYKTQAPVMATRINKGEVQAFLPQGQWQATSSKGGKLFVRWIGENGEYGDQASAVEEEATQWESPGSTAPATSNGSAEEVLDFSGSTSA